MDIDKNKLKDLLEKALQTREDYSDDIIQDLSDFAGESEIHFVYTFTTLYRLILQPDLKNAFTLRKIAHLIIDHLNIPVDKYKPFLELIETSNVYAQHSEVVQNIANMKSEGKSTAIEIIKIHRAFTDSSPPSIDLIRDEQFIEIILKDVFNLNNQSESQIDKKIWLLAVASSHTGNEPMGTSSITKQSIIAMQKFKSLISSLTTATDMKDNLDNLALAINNPLTCFALITWISTLLQDTAFYEYNIITLQQPPPVFELLLQIAIQRPSHTKYVFNVFAENLIKEYPSNTPALALAALQIKQKFMEYICQLVRTGPSSLSHMLIYIQRNKSLIDDSLVIDFISTIFNTFQLEPFAPPLVLSTIIDLCSCISSAQLIGPLQSQLELFCDRMKRNEMFDDKIKGLIELIK